MYFPSRQLHHTASWDPSSQIGAPKLGRDSKNISLGGDSAAQPNCPAEPTVVEATHHQDVIPASSSDYSNSEDEYTHIEEPTPVSKGRKVCVKLKVSSAWYNHDFHECRYKFLLVTFRLVMD